MIEPKETFIQKDNDNKNQLENLLNIVITTDPTNEDDLAKKEFIERTTIRNRLVNRLSEKINSEKSFEGDLVSTNVKTIGAGTLDVVVANRQYYNPFNKQKQEDVNNKILNKFRNKINPDMSFQNNSFLFTDNKYRDVILEHELDEAKRQLEINKNFTNRRMNNVIQQSKTEFEIPVEQFRYYRKFNDDKNMVGKRLETIPEIFDRTYDLVNSEKFKGGCYCDDNMTSSDEELEGQKINFSDLHKIKFKKTKKNTSGNTYGKKL
jgi:hypothetical protein